MTIKRWCCIGFVIIFLFAIAIVIYAKTNFNNVDYYQYIKTSPYNFVSSINDEINAWGEPDMNYEDMFHLHEFFIDEKISSFEDLKNLSDYILIVSNNESPIFKGNGIINECSILKVIKGEGLKENDKIKIYDLIFHWDLVRTFYLNGNTPLKIGDEYIVFLRNPERASMPDTFVFNNVKYGRVSILENREILENYEQAALKVEEILNYDFVFSPNADKEVNNYTKMVKQIREFAKKEMN